MSKLFKKIETIRYTGSQHLLGIWDRGEIAKSAIAEKVGISPSYLNDIVRGRRNCTPQIKAEIEQALKDVESHLGRVDL